jgi:DNA repair protein RadA/Sms
MTDGGLREVANPSLAFLSERRGVEPGTAVVASLEGTRPLLVEVQALVATSFYGTPQRVTSGFDQRRLALLIAVLERRVGLRLGRHDVFVAVTGGLTLDEPGTDLGLALAVASSYRNRPVLEGTLAVGEMSLSGELRRVSRIEARVREAAALGFKRAAVPAMQASDARTEGIEVVPVATVREAIAELLGAKVEVRPPAGPATGAPRPDAAAKPGGRS